jgi:hypothetical protein
MPSSTRIPFTNKRAGFTSFPHFNRHLLLGSASISGAASTHLLFFVGSLVLDRGIWGTVPALIYVIAIGDSINGLLTRESRFREYKTLQVKSFDRSMVITQI